MKHGSEFHREQKTVVLFGVTKPDTVNVKFAQDKIILPQPSSDSED